MPEPELPGETFPHSMSDLDYLLRKEGLHALEEELEEEEPWPEYAPPPKMSPSRAKCELDKVARRLNSIAGGLETEYDIRKRFVEQNRNQNRWAIETLQHLYSEIGTFLQEEEGEESSYVVRVPRESLGRWHALVWDAFGTLNYPPVG